jgi:hypothetical protein
MDATYINRLTQCAKEELSQTDLNEMQRKEENVPKQA